MTDAPASLLSPRAAVLLLALWAWLAALTLGLAAALAQINL